MLPSRRLITGAGGRQVNRRFINGVRVQHLEKLPGGGDGEACFKQKGNSPGVKAGAASQQGDRLVRRTRGTGWRTWGTACTQNKGDRLEDVDKTLAEVWGTKGRVQTGAWSGKQELD